MTPVFVHSFNCNVLLLWRYRRSALIETLLCCYLFIVVAISLYLRFEWVFPRRSLLEFVPDFLDFWIGVCLGDFPEKLLEILLGVSIPLLHL